MKKVWIGVFVLLFFLWAVIIFFGQSLGLSERWVRGIQIGLWVGSMAAFGGALTEDGRTDGDLIAGAEDEDGLVFALKTPVDELIQKDKVTFNVLKERQE